MHSGPASRLSRRRGRSCRPTPGVTWHPDKVTQLHGDRKRHREFQAIGADSSAWGDSFPGRTCNGRELGGGDFGRAGRSRPCPKTSHERAEVCAWAFRLAEHRSKARSGLCPRAESTTIRPCASQATRCKLRDGYAEVKQASSKSNHTVKSPRIVIVGLDAATFDLIGPWAAEGKLPNLNALMRNGAWGKLASILPPITPPAWTSFMTGKNPGKHGIFHFMEASPGTYGFRYLNAGSRRAKTIWRILSDAGYSVGTINIPFTYPPEQLSGFQISGMDTPSEKSSFIYPPELRSELEGLLGRFKLDLRYLGYMTTDPRRHEVLAEMEKLDRQWLGASLYLMRKYAAGVMMFTFMSIDTVQHHFWQYMDRNHHLHDSAAAKHFGDAILRVYQRLDDAIGQLLRETSSGTSVFIVSDHGGGPTSDRVVYLNRYLAQLGLLYYREDKSSALEKLGNKIVRGSYTLLRNALSSR